MDVQELVNHIMDIKSEIANTNSAVATMKGELKSEIAATNSTVATMKGELKTTWKRIDEQTSLTETVHQLALSVRDLVNEQKNTSKAVVNLRKDVDDLQSKPSKRLDSLTNIIMSALVGGVITFLFVQMGLK